MWQSLNQTWHYVEKWADETPHSEALVFKNHRLTWLDVKTEMDKIALALIDIGVNKGDSVAFLAMAQNEFITSYMAANKVGAVWLGLNPKFTLDELRYQIADSQPKALIMLRSFMDNDLSENITQLMQEFSFLTKVLVMGEPFSGAENFHDYIAQPRENLISKLELRVKQLNENDSVLLMYTSGSTGKPKGVVHTHKSIIQNIAAQIKKFAMHPKSRTLLHFPINHVAADVEIGFAMIMVGGCSVMMDSFHPIESLKVIEQEKITLLGQMPVMFLLQMKQPEFKQTDFSHIEQFLWAGAAAPKIMIETLRKIADQIGATIITGYGSTESCGFVTYTEEGDSLEYLENTAGKIVKPFELKIVDDERKTLANGEIGEIAIRGSFMFKEYLNKAEETAKVIDNDGWFYTNDLAYKDENDYITIVGRKSEMFKSGGENIFPREIEEVLETHPSVIFAAVIGVPDDLYQEVGWAYVMCDPKVEVAKEELEQLCKNKLVNFKVPKQFFLSNNLPLLATGKINKVALKKQAIARLENSQDEKS